MSNQVLYNEDCKLIIGDELVNQGGVRHMYFQKPNGSIKCIGTLMGTIKSLKKTVICTMGDV